MSRFDGYDESDDVLDEESDTYYESENDTRNDDDYDEVDMDGNEEKENHFQCQRAGTCIFGCEDCDLESECSMCEHDGDSSYCDNCTVADEY